LRGITDLRSDGDVFGARSKPPSPTLPPQGGTGAPNGETPGVCANKEAGTADFGSPSPLSGGGGQGEGAYQRWYVPATTREAIKSAARDLRKNPTRSEQILWQALRRNQLGPAFRRQQPIGSFIADFYCPSARLVIEVDGSIHESQALSDLERQRIVESLGIRFVRFSASVVEKHLDSVIGQIRSNLSANQGPTS
jgi:very-short-patch-repair endonuclease